MSEIGFGHLRPEAFYHNRIADARARLLESTRILLRGSLWRGEATTGESSQRRACRWH